MPQASPAVIEMARKNERTVLHAFARVTQARIAEQMGVNDSTVSRLKDGQLEQMCLLLAACGLKCVPVEMQCYSRDMVHALLTLSRDRLVQLEHPEELTWD